MNVSRFLMLSLTAVVFSTSHLSAETTGDTEQRSFQASNALNFTKASESSWELKGYRVYGSGPNKGAAYVISGPSTTPVNGGTQTTRFVNNWYNVKEPVSYNFNQAKCLLLLNNSDPFGRRSIFFTGVYDDKALTVTQVSLVTFTTTVAISPAAKACIEKWKDPSPN